MIRTCVLLDPVFSSRSRKLPPSLLRIDVEFNVTANEIKFWLTSKKFVNVGKIKEFSMYLPKPSTREFTQLFYTRIKVKASPNTRSPDSWDSNRRNKRMKERKGKKVAFDFIASHSAARRNNTCAGGDSSAPPPARVGVKYEGGNSAPQRPHFPTRYHAKQPRGPFVKLRTFHSSNFGRSTRGQRKKVNTID